jgi:hypothetical protein
MLAPLASYCHRADKVVLLCGEGKEGRRKERKEEPGKHDEDEEYTAKELQDQPKKIYAHPQI